MTAAVFPHKEPTELLNFDGKKRLPMVLQAEAAECGLACLAMISSYYGYNIDIVSLRKRFTFSSHGTNLKQLRDMASRLNLSSRALRLELSEVQQIQTPCILHWDMCHFVVLKAVSTKAFTIHDPASGIRQLSYNQFANHFTGVALELAPNDEFEVKNAVQKLKLNQFWRRVIGLKSSLAHILALSVVLQVLAVVSPLYMQTVIDDVIIKSDKDLLVILAVGFGALMLVRAFTNAVRQYLVLHLSTKLNIQMAARLFSHLIRLPLDYFEKRHMGDIVSRFSSLEDIRSLITTKFVTAIVDSLMAVITLVAMLIYSVELGMVVLSFVAVYACARTIFYSTYRIVSEEAIAAEAKEESCFMESIRAIQTIKIFQKEPDRQNAWQNSYAEALNGRIRIARWDISYGLINAIVFGLEGIVVIYLAANLVIDSVMSIGMLYAFMSFKQQFVERMEGLISALFDYKLVGMHLERLSDIVFTEVDKGAGGFFQVACNDKDIEGEIEVRDLFFRYAESEPYAVHGVSFKVARGESVAIVAPSGGGKTTLLKCMMGLLSPEHGKILVDGQEVHTLARFRQQIAGVMQDDQLLSGTIADNIACFDAQLNMDKVKDCAKAAAIHDEIMAMNMQYNTFVGDMGASLSGGQRQRVVLARALYRNPKVLFLDEATSHLDVDNESIVNENIHRLNITRIIISHRPETIARADRVVRLDDNA